MDLAAGSLAAFDGDGMAGFVAAEFQPRVTGPEHRVLIHGGVHPAHRRRGLGTRLLREGVGLAQALHARHHPDLDLAVDVRNLEQVAGSAALFEREGFRKIRRYMEMDRALDDVPPAAEPAGMRIEPWSEETDPEFMAVRNAAFKDHWGSAMHTPESWRMRSRGANFQPELTFLARDVATGKPAGIALTHRWHNSDTPDDPDGTDGTGGTKEAAEGTSAGNARIQIVATVREFRKRGVAGALIRQVLNGAAEQGYAKASLYVDGSNPTGAVAVYEQAGFVTVRASNLWTWGGA
jgi:mycothiol synthase